MEKIKSVLLSIQPKWCELIANRKKTIEIRKTKPKIKTPFKVYIYCTKQNVPGEILLTYNKKVEGRNKGFRDNGDIPLAGKVIGEFICDCILSHCEMANADIAEQQGCIKREKLFEYADSEELYGWHISDLIIYDEPKLIDDFYNADKCPYESKAGCTYKYYCYRAGQAKKCKGTLTKPPKNWCYVEKN